MREAGLPPKIVFCDARSEDADAVAELHASSWRSAYQGILTPDFLERRVVEDRRALWHSRLSNDRSAGQLVRLAIEDGQLVGFICVLLDEDDQWGALIDNLHVRPDRKGRRIGRRLMGDAAVWVGRHRPLSPMHLWVYETNVPARRFYERIGGTADQRVLQQAPDGHEVPAVRYVWTDPARLGDMTGVRTR